jgi:superfamily I DNA/RNA helicase/RecB family exonuclease
MQSTQELLDGLNAAQAAAVAHPIRSEATPDAGGPLIVLAGPGTGKTHVLTRRIAYLIKVLGRDPSKVLAVTFTVKAASELRSRIAELVGPAMAARVRCHTFNGYGHTLIERFGHYLHLPRKLTLIDQVQSRRLLSEIILEKNLYPESRGQGMQSLVDLVSDKIGQMTNAGADPGACERAAKGWEARIAAIADPVEAQAQLASLTQFRYAAAAFAEYNTRRYARGLISYDDQISLPTALLNTSREAGAIIRAEVTSVIVDEFQDCNPAQLKFLEALIGPRSHGGRPDLTVVGDDDQAIYGFRGSDDRVFERFERTYAACAPTVVQLTDNHRSQQTIITFANRVISGADHRFRPDKVINFPQGKATAKAWTHGVTLPKDNDDADVVAALVLSAKARAAAEGREFAYSDIAVIARTHRDLDRIADGLGLYDIPVHRAQKRGLLTNIYVEDVLAWVQWILDPADTVAARRCLVRPPIGIPSGVVTLWQRTFAAYRGRAAAKLDDGTSPHAAADFESYLERIAAGTVMLGSKPGGSGDEDEVSYVSADEADLGSEPTASEDAQDDEATRTDDEAQHHEKVTIALARVRQLRLAAENVPADEAILLILRACSLGAAQLESARDRHAHLMGMLELLSFAREKQPRLSEPGSLRELADYLREWGDLTKAAAEKEIDLPLDGESRSTDERTPNAVALLTAHASKGLEFQMVIVPRINGSAGYPKSMRADRPDSLPTELLDFPGGRDAKTAHYDEERRLFYVACTRAKQYLYLLYKPAATPGENSLNAEFHPPKGTVYLDKVSTSAQVLAEAAGYGMFTVPGQDGAALEATAARNAAEAARVHADRIRAAARLAIASAVDRTGAEGFDPANINQLGAVLRESLEVIAAANFAQRTGQAPVWTGIGEGAVRVGAQVARLRSAVSRSEQLPGGMLVPPKGPLTLSFTQIDQYNRCKRCWYLRYIAKLPQAQSREAGIGTLVHSVLERYFALVRDAEGAGIHTPGPDELVQMTRSEYARSLSPQQPPDPALLDQLLAQVGAAVRLHSHTDHILELEKSFKFEHPCRGMLHSISAKIDRIDAPSPAHDNRMRIIDYKSGQSSKGRLSPSKTDLQLNIYLMALAAEYGDETPAQAEYWMLGTAERGVLTSSDANTDKVRSNIDTVINGILSGDFTRANNCEGDCALMSGM